MRLLDCKNDECKKIGANAPSILDYLCEDCSNHFDKVKKYLTSVGVNFEVDDKIVRGLDYYTKTVFEFVSTDIGAQGTICGGGRYDGLIEQLGGPKMPGIGFAVGIERLLMLMERNGVNLNKDAITLYIAPMDENAKEKAFELVNELRRLGVACDFDHMDRGIKSQFKYADKIGAKYVGVIGSTEMEKGVVRVKNMTEGTEEEVSFESLKDYVK